MDTKDSRQLKLGNRWRELKALKRRTSGSKKHTIGSFLSSHKQTLLASALLIVFVVLLFGIFSQFQPPTTNTPPSGVTVVDYSTFLGQVKAGNVMAVTLRGNEVNGLLVNPLSQQGQQTPKNTSATMDANKRAADFAAWSRYVGAGYPSSWSTTSTTPAPIDLSRIVYTHSPQSGDPTLMSLLISNHVMISTFPVPQPPLWIGLLWRIAPLVLLVPILMLILTPRNSARAPRTLDDRFSQFGKSRVRRFESVKEPNTSTPSPRQNAGKTAPTTNIPGTAGISRVSIEPPVTFADVAGIDEVRTELEEIVQFLRNPGYYDRLGARIPRGALLVGPPGTGKTLLAKAVAGEAGVPFFSMSASEFVEMFVGVGASRVRDLFNQARQAAPSVIFIDELDAVGRKRSMRITGNDERDQTLNQLLVELDGFDPRHAIVVLAATNRVDILDKALLRPGRFDRHITVSMPDRKGRQAILAVHTRRTPLHPDVSLERLARLTTGMSGADLANLVNEAALCAARKNLECIPHECFEDALARVQLGALRPIVMSEHERRIIAFHEGGHALVAHHLPEADRVNCVTILPRGQSLGVTQFIAEEDRYNYSRHTLMSRIAVGLGGRVAEELTFGADHITTGAENDLQVVTDLARRMVTRWGMSEQVGVVFADYQGGAGLNMSCIDPNDVPLQARSLVTDEDGNLHLNGADIPQRQHNFAMAMPGMGSPSSASMASVIDSEVQRILNEGREMARTLLTEHYDQLARLADTLMERELLNRAEFEALLRE